MNRFQISLRGLLLVVVLICATTIPIRNFLDRKAFRDLKKDSVQTLFELEWHPDQRTALEEAFETLRYENRQVPRIAFAAVETARIANKLKRLGMGPHLLTVGVIDLERRADAIRLTLPDGSFIDHPLETESNAEWNGESNADPFYRQATFFLGQLGIADGNQIESLVLVVNGEVCSESVRPVLQERAANSE